MSARRILIAANVEDAVLAMLEQGWGRSETTVVVGVGSATAAAKTLAELGVHATARSLFMPHFEEIRAILKAEGPVRILNQPADQVYAPAETSPSSAGASLPPTEPDPSLPLTALGGVALPHRSSDDDLAADMAADAAIRRLQAAATLLHDAEAVLRHAAEQLSVISTSAPQRHFATSLYQPLTRASVEVASALESIRNVVPEVQ